MIAECKNHLLLLMCLLSLNISCTSDTDKKSQQPKTKKTFIRSMINEPETLHPIQYTDTYAKEILDHVFDTLLERDLNTYELKPHLAEKWHVNKDNTLFTFTLRKNLKWHDGRPLTIKDVMFSFKAFTDISYGGYRFLPYFENIESAEIIDTHRIQFKAGKKYAYNLSTLGTSLRILPEHIYKSKDKKLSKTLIGSGPYILKQYKRGKHILLDQNEHWWGRSVQPKEHRIKKIVFRFIKDENSQLMRMAAGDLDFLELTPEAYMKKTKTPP